MKIKRFNAENTRSARHGRATVNLNKKGPLTFSQTAIKLLGFTAGSNVEILQDEDSPKDWYLLPTAGDAGFEVRMKNERTATFNSSYLVAEILRSLDIYHNSTFLIASEPTDIDGELAYAIITKSAK